MALPKTFCGQAVVGSAGPFLVTVAPDSPQTRAGAEAILACAAQDLATLEDWFSYRWSDQPYGPWVSVGDDASPHAASDWFYGNQSPRITLWGATLANSGGSATIRDELARAMFVFELAELFMHAAPTNWSPHNSAGEALSRVAGAELHPTGYYRPAGSPNNGPYSTEWLQLPWRRRAAQPDGIDEDRYDFVTLSLGTDKDVRSFGCGILFLYYLHDQLRYSWKQIASSNGDHLAQTFAELTGRPQQSAFPEFADILDAHLPPGTTLVPPRESVFPLRTHPTVLLYETYGTSHSAPRNDGLHMASLKPGPDCPNASYEYHVLNVTTRVSITARAPGSFAPTFLWFVGGTRVTRGPAQQVTVRVRVVDTRPGTGEPAQDDVPLQLWCTVTDSATTSQLDIVNLDFPGNTEGFEVKTVLSEAGMSVIPGLVNTTTTVAPRTRSYAMSQQWYRDVERCNADALWQVGVYRNALLAKVFDLKNWPDPPSPEVLADLVAAAARYGDAAQELTRTTSGVADTLEKLVPALAAGLTATDAAEEVRVDGHVFRTLPAQAAAPTDASDASG
ncbi:hypothetical protein ACQPYH_06375 [Kribbella sp. CA-245084]|uniref:hypothetical protein n=1 Tax=Kribbella sp. CA-245084 TaxID=3239940 RepID=UPI003D8FC13B